jgi:hypothetical protein
MPEATLLHRLYTNAAAGGQSQETGARAIPLEERDAANVVSADVLAGLDDLLRKTQPAGNETAWVVRRFAAPDGDSYACVIASYPDLVRDAKGRAGFLNHARLVRVAEPSFDVTAIVEMAESFPIQEICATPEADRLAAYVNLVSGEDRVAIRPVAVAELQQLPRAFLADFLAACFAGLGQSQRMRFALTAPTIENLALAWAAVPLALQRSSSWAIGTDDSCSVDAIFAPQGKPPAQVASAAMLQCVKRYVALLDSHDFGAILGNASIKTVVALDEVVKRATVAAPLAQEMEMQTKKSKPRRDEWEPLDADTIAELKRQHEAMEESLRHYVDQRLAALERQPSRGNTPSLATFAAWIPSLALLAILLIGSGAYWFANLRKPSTHSVAAEEQARTEEERPTFTPSTTETQPARIEQTSAQRAVAATETSGKWADALRDYLASDANTAARAIADLAATASSGRRTLDEFASRVAAGTDLKPEGRERLRALLVDAIAAQNDAGVTVDGKLADVDMARLKKEYSATATKPIDAQSEIILRWMAGAGR